MAAGRGYVSCASFAVADRRWCLSMRCIFGMQEQSVTLKRTTCKHCRGKLEPGQRIHPECVDAYAEAQGAKAQRKAEKAARIAAKEDRAETRKKLQAMAPLRDLIRDAQTAFNAWVRARDAGEPCISCLSYNPPDFGVGGAWDAGHFLGRGAYPEKRFMEDNVHKQCKVCNGGSAANPAKALTVTQAYEINLIARIGQERVDAVKAPMPVRKWSRQELIEIKDTYKQKLKDLKR